MLKMFILLLAYAIAPIVAGHGIMPMAWLLVHSSEWQLALAWGAIVVGLAALVCLRAGSSAQIVAQLASALMLYGAWLANVRYAIQLNGQAEQRMALESMLILSLPFQIVTVVVVCVLAVQLKRVLS